MAWLCKCNSFTWRELQSTVECLQFILCQLLVLIKIKACYLGHDLSYVAYRNILLELYIIGCKSNYLLVKPVITEECQVPHLEPHLLSNYLKGVVTECPMTMSLPAIARLLREMFYICWEWLQISMSVFIIWFGQARLWKQTSQRLPGAPVFKLRWKRGLNFKSSFLIVLKDYHKSSFVFAECFKRAIL